MKNKNKFLLVAVTLFTFNVLAHELTDISFFDVEQEEKILKQIGEESDIFSDTYEVTYVPPAKNTRKSSVERDAQGRFMCPWPGCKNSYAQAGAIRRHMMKHTKVRPFVCSKENCNKSFIRKYHRDKHEETPHGYKEYAPQKRSKPYHCQHQDCPSTFTSPGHLARHLRNMHKGQVE